VTAVWAEFKDFQLAYGRNYSSQAERHARFKQFLDNRMLHGKHNDGGSQVGINELSDYFPAEIQAQKLGHVPPTQSASANTPSGIAAVPSDIPGNRRRGLLETLPCTYPWACFPSSLDWSAATCGAGSCVGAVKAQYCGAFSVLSRRD
jgi:hypothetical protein